MSHSHNEKVFDPKNAARLDSPERQERIPPGAIIEAAQLVSGYRVADIGSGTGYFSLALLNSSTPPAAIEAVDSSSEMNSYFKKRLEDHPLGTRVSIHVGHGEKLPLGSSSIDLLIMGNVFHEFESPSEALREATRVLRSEGRILIVDWAIPADRSQPLELGPPYEHRRSEQEVKQSLIEAGFSAVQLHGGFKDSYGISARKP
ncbi:MAG TPA: hypothetical protein DCS07_04040 [Bdellovibrionales bacterium]|nr:MAG: hypothetical protein A2Z97_11845 [Bdellovibrionales bacterium GWB1_52_6]OFZ05348.1 MAG: hypothetical protein A2X97_16510 [Bdellovibrionales bacterium GWA1_52_35]OFZ43316.1 MAG: hypothetical protein A2070_02810 [Bdellovibrionales bacterium GWC1_52_8]HAR41788.1 hypothetical protein [Bdellovibrionales bacterium]HCM39011.1 hypothetical protein [Bdellovibrionales bacterium]